MNETTRQRKAEERVAFRIDMRSTTEIRAGYQNTKAFQEGWSQIFDDHAGFCRKCDHTLAWCECQS